MNGPDIVKRLADCNFVAQGLTQRQTFFEIFQGACVVALVSVDDADIIECVAEDLFVTCFLCQPQTSLHVIERAGIVSVETFNRADVIKCAGGHCAIALGRFQRQILLEQLQSLLIFSAREIINSQVG